MNLAEIMKKDGWQARSLTIGVMLIIFYLALFFMHIKPEAIYLQIPDLGHRLIPNIRETFGNYAAYIWWLGSVSEEIYAVILMLVIACTGQAARWGIAFALVALLHSMCWHFTTLPIPPDILWQFPFITGQVPMPNDFWFSGHVGNALLLVLYTQRKAWWIQVLSYLYLVFMIWLVLATRTHYSIDIIGGLFATYTVYMLVDKYYPISKFK